VIIPTPYSINITAPKRAYGPSKSSKAGGESANRNYYYRSGRQKPFPGKGPGPAVVVSLSEEAMGIEGEGEEEAEYFIYDRFGRLMKCGV
jgi:hypothetical protein